MNREILTQGEEAALCLRELYHSNGYEFYRMSRFEEYDFYAGKKDFLTSPSVLAFTDLDGSLMALRPDVTLSIIRRAEPGKYYYSEKIYRPKGGKFAEISQCGIECTGTYDFREILRLAAMSLHAVSDGRKCALDVADAGRVSALIPPGMNAEILRCLSSKNIHGLREINAPEEIIDMCETVSDYPAGLDEYSDEIHTDYSAVTTLSYYTGNVLKGYIDGIPEAVLSGGEYTVDGVKGAGFAVYIDAVTGAER